MYYFILIKGIFEQLVIIIYVGSKVSPLI